ncbi:MAG: glycosyl hydrolase, partial [Acidobacteriota bacterium]|nr:glycosyl hydrolase [Acidobacteriota bacterium]
MIHTPRLVLATLLAVAVAGALLTARQPAALSMPFDALQWRSLGPLRGGRSIAASGSSSRSFEYYFGATGGGLWKTTDAGTSWAPVTDGQIASSSVGAIAVSPSQPDTVYIGMGEAQLRGNVMQGDGVYKSIDAGKTWRHVGLADTLTIARLRVHPRDPDLVYAAALGDPTGPSESRGVYRSRDGGATWQKILFRDNQTGAVDLALDPSSPSTLYAALWQVRRGPWQLWSGGPGSGLFKSTDSGDTWAEISRAPGMPPGVIGKIGITVSGANSRRLYAIVEAAAGGLYRSDDAGASWRLVNPSRDLWQRSFYFNRVVADPVDADTVYVLNFVAARSTDGGSTYSFLQTAHADTHDLWIDPGNPARMILSDDGGAAVSVNAGASWTPQAYA